MQAPRNVHRQSLTSSRQVTSSLKRLRAAYSSDRPDRATIEFGKLEALAVDPQRPFEIRNQGGLALVMKFMRKYSDDKAIQLYGINLLGALGCGNRILIANIVAQDAVPIMFAALQRWPDYGDLYSMTLLALGKLAYLSDARDAIVSRGGHSLAIDALHRFPEHESLHRYGLMFLANVATLEDVAVSVCEKGGAALAQKATLRTSWATSALLWKNALTLIGNLAVMEENRNQICQVAIDTAVRAMQLFPRLISVHAAAMRVLANLSFTEELCEEVLQQKRVCHVIADARREFHDTRMVMKYLRQFDENIRPFT